MTHVTPYRKELSLAVVSLNHACRRLYHSPMDDLDPEFGARLLEHMWQLWIEPELQRHGMDMSLDEVRKIVVELPPDGDPVVLLNDEASVIARFVAARAIAAGEEIYQQDIREIKGIEPEEVGPNSGWICFARLPTGEQYIAFDFTYNRERATRLIERAEQFLASAQHLGRDSLAVALDNAFSAAELAVQVQMLVMQEETHSHKVRGKWLEKWTELGNAPEEHSHILWELADLRKKARYEAASPSVDDQRFDRIIRVIVDMINEARSRVVARRGSD